MAERSLAARTHKWTWIVSALVLGAIGTGIVVADPPKKAASGSNPPPAGSAAKPGADSSPVISSFGSGDTAVARVNNDVITYKALAEECIARKGAEVLDTMVSKMLVVQACRENGIKVTAKEIDDEIGRTAERLKMTREQYLKVLQNERGISYKRYAEDIVWPGLALKKLAKPGVKVTNEDIERGFEAQFGEKVQCRWIKFDDKQNAMRVWNELRELSKNGDGKVDLVVFENKAAKWSTDVASRSIGGQLQPISHHTSPAFQAVENAAFGLQEDGDISKVVTLPDSSWVILFRERRIPPVDAKLENVRALLEEQIYEVKLRDEITQIFEKLRKSATIESLLTGDSSTPEKNPVDSGKAKEDPAKVGSTQDTTKKTPPTTRK